MPQPRSRCLQIGCGCALGWLLARHELPRAAPLIPFDLLRIRVFSLSLATSVCSFMAQMTALVALPFEIQRLGHSAVETGLFMTPWPLALALAAPLAGRLRTAMRRHTGRTRAAVMPRAGVARVPSGERQPRGIRVAHGAVRSGLWLLPGPQQRAIMASAPRARSGAAGAC